MEIKKIKLLKENFQNGIKKTKSGIFLQQLNQHVRRLIPDQDNSINTTESPNIIIFNKRSHQLCLIVGHYLSLCGMPLNSTTRVPDHNIFLNFFSLSLSHDHFLLLAGLRLNTFCYCLSILKYLHAFRW